MIFLALPAAFAAKAAPPPGADADAALIEACRSEPNMAKRDPRECGERLLRQCLADAGDAARQAQSVIACEKRRGDAWNVIARKAYHDIEAKLGAEDKRRLRTSQVQFELELADLCAAIRGLGAGDPDVATASCASDVIAARALSLSRLAAGRGASTP
jgi:hypothetical protein